MDCHCGCHTSLSPLLCMAGTTGLEPATSAVTGQRSDQLSYVPRLFFNNLGLCHIESSGSQLSLFSLSSTISLLWTQFRASVDTTWTPRWTPKSANPTTKFSVSDEPAIWCPPPRSQRLHLFQSHIVRWSPTCWRLKVRYRTNKTRSKLGARTLRDS